MRAPGLLEWSPRDTARSLGTQGDSWAWQFPWRLSGENRGCCNRICGGMNTGSFSTIRGPEGGSYGRSNRTKERNEKKSRAKLNTDGPCVTVNFMCQLSRVRAPAVGSNITLEVSMRMFWDETSTKIGHLKESRLPFQKVGGLQPIDYRPEEKDKTELPQAGRLPSDFP